MSASSPTDSTIGRTPEATPDRNAAQAIPDFRGGYYPLVEAKDSWHAVLLRGFSTVAAAISRWPPEQFIALAVVVALTFLGGKLIEAREVLGGVVTLIGVVSTGLLITIVGVISLLKNEKSKRNTEGTPQS